MLRAARKVLRRSGVNPCAPCNATQRVDSLSFSDSPCPPTLERSMAAGVLPKSRGPATSIRQLSTTVYCGPRPSEGQVQELQRRGVRTLINLEDYLSSSKKARKREMLNAQHHALPERPMHMEWHPLSPLFPLSDASIANVFKLLGDASQLPVYIHCRFGRERTNLVAALYRVHFEHWSPEQAYAQMVRDGFRPYLVPAMYTQCFNLLKKYFRPKPAASPKAEAAF